jgi:hypothetical protein
MILSYEEIALEIIQLMEQARVKMEALRVSTSEFDMRALSNCRVGDCSALVGECKTRVMGDPAPSVIRDIEAAAEVFLKKNDRFPRFVFVGIEIFEGVKQHFFDQRMFVNHRTLRTVVGDRRGIEGTALGVDNILPTAHLSDYEVGPMESVFEVVNSR